MFIQLTLLGGSVTEELTNSNDSGIDHDADRYPELAAVLAWIRDDEDLNTSAVEKVEVTLFASGEATYRVWEPRADEPQIGYIPAADL